MLKYGNILRLLIRMPLFTLANYVFSSSLSRARVLVDPFYLLLAFAVEEACNKETRVQVSSDYSEIYGQ